MGGIKSYKRDGKGMLLYDDGSSAFCSYNYDTQNGHNVIIR
jgi:hypothetical protein